MLLKKLMKIRLGTSESLLSNGSCVLDAWFQILMNVRSAILSQPLEIQLV